MWTNEYFDIIENANINNLRNCDNPLPLIDPMNYSLSPLKVFEIMFFKEVQQIF
jgi:hypothetical protein